MKKFKVGDLVIVKDVPEKKLFKENAWEIDHIISFPDDNEDVYECFNLSDDTRELFCFYMDELEEYRDEELECF